MSDRAAEPRQTAEAIPFWCDVGDIPYERMWDDDRVWLPQLIEGIPLVGEFLMHEGRLIAHRLRPTTVAELIAAVGRPLD